MGIDRALAFKILIVSATPETHGCWAGATGNFDKQVISLGALQWNYGQGSLQRSFRLFKAHYLTPAAFAAEKNRLAPKYGDLVFGSGCLQDKNITAECKRGVLALQHGKGNLNADFAAEMEAVFNSDAMVQISMDRYISLLTSLEDDLVKLFGTGQKTLLKVKWALDTKVQQGHFPDMADVQTMRNLSSKLNAAEKQKRMHSTVMWYDGACGAVWSEGCRLDHDYNVKVWHPEIDARYSEDRFDLLTLSQMRAMTAMTKNGAYQANAFQRRATLVFGIGSVAGRRVP